MLLPLRSLGAALACSALIPAAAHADNVQTLDPHAQSPGHVLLNPSGSALIAWTSDPGVTDKAPIPRVCVLPRGSQCGVPVTLTLPGAGPGDLVDAGDGVEAVFPVAGPGSTVWVFGPRASHGDVLRWTSHDGGATYGTATAIAGADTNGLVDPEDALTLGTTTLFGLAGSASLGVGALDAGGSAGVLANAGPNVQTSSLALDASGNPVIAYFNQGANEQAGDSKVRFFRYASSDHSIAALGTSANWSGPHPLSTGYEPLLSGGAGGLFAVTKDGDGVARPTVLHVRKDDGRGFGDPIATLATDADDELFDSGAAAQSPAGHLAVLWPAVRAGDDLRVMRMYTTDDGGNSFRQADVAAIGSDYRGDRNAQAAIDDAGQGVLTFRDGDALQVADLSAIAPFTVPASTPADPAPPQPPATATPTPVSRPPRAPFLYTRTRVGGDVITLRTPNGCVNANGIVVRLSVRSRNANGHVVLKLRKVQFRYDGRLVRTLRHAPFSARLRLNPQPGSAHTISARAFLRERGHRRITRTLERRFSACR